MKKQYMAFCLSLVMLFAAAAGNADASGCTWFADLTSLQAVGPLDVFGLAFNSFSLLGNVSVQQTDQGPDIGLTLASLTGLPSPPICPHPSDEANVSLRYSTAGLLIPSVFYGGSLYSTYLTVDLAADSGSVDLPFTNLITPLTTADAQRGAVSATWDIYAAMNFNLIAGLAHDSFIFKNTQPIACNYGGTGTATYDPTTNTSIVSVTDCAVVPWSFCTGALAVFPSALLPLVSAESVFVSSPSLNCVGVFADYTSDITFTDSATIITPGSQGIQYNLSGTFDGTLSFPTFTVPVNSNVQNLSIMSISNGTELLLFDISGAGFKECFGKWYAYDTSSVVNIHGDGTTTGTVIVVMPELTDTIQAVLNTDGTVFVNSNLSSIPGTMTYPNIENYYANCAAP